MYFLAGGGVGITAVSEVFQAVTGMLQAKIKFQVKFFFLT